MLSDLKILTLAVLIVLAEKLGEAQACPPGELRVLVKDSQESAIFDAKVRLGSAAKELAVQTTKTVGAAGFQNVPCGSWTVRASKNGFEDASAEVQIGREPVAEITLILDPEMARSSIDVKDTPPPVSQSSSRIMNCIPRR